MGIEYLRVWHWCIIGILMGAAFAFIKLQSGVPEPQGLEVVKLHVLEDQLIAAADPSKRSVVEVRNIRIHPAGLGTFNVEGIRDPVVASFISYDLVLARNDKSKLADVLPRQTLLENPGPKKHAAVFVRDRTILGKLDHLHESIETDHLTLAQYLDKLNEIIEKLDKTEDRGRYASAAQVTYKYNWWETPKSVYWMYTSGGFIVIGLIFPTLLQLLTIAGYGRQRKTTEDEEYLARFKGGEEAQVAKPAIPVDAAEQLAALEAELEAKLKAGASDAPADPAPAAPAKPVVAVLTAGKLEKPKESDLKKAPRKGYGADQGDFYPTEVHGKKKT